jgi:hypothetical protein
MCLTVNFKTRQAARDAKKTPFIAAKNITVWKVVEKENGKFKSPYMSAFKWEEGQTYTSKLKCKVEKSEYNGWLLQVDEGLHAAMTKQMAMNIFYYSNTRRIIEMIIPKGAKYYIGNRGDIVADTMKFPIGAKIYTTKQFKKAYPL